MLDYKQIESLILREFQGQESAYKCFGMFQKIEEILW